jgi:hypothetical protein
MFEHGWYRGRSVKNDNKIKSAKDFIARKKLKSANQSHKGIKKRI